MSKKHLEIVQWLDHCGYDDSGWHSLDAFEELEPLKMVSVGYVIKDAPKHIVLVSTVAESGTGRGDICIMKNAIIKRRKLKVPV